MIRGNVTGILNTIRHLNRVSRSLETKAHDFLERLGQEGFKVADAKFANALYAGTNDVTVELQWEDETTLHLVANGDAVAFIEFGTGTLVEDYPKKVDGILEHGQFGQKKGAHPPWYYHGDPGNIGRPKRNRDGTYDPDTVVTWGNPPARAMFDAGQEMRNRIAEIAREVFSK